MPRYFLYLFFLFNCSFASAQNLIPNGNLEDTVPSFFGQKFAQFWINPTQSSPDYYTSFHIGDFSAPQNVAGYQIARSGIAYIGLSIYGLFNSGDQRRDYLRVRLKRDLELDSTYCLRFYISLADSMQFASRNQLGILFVDFPLNSNNNLVLPYTPQIIVSPTEYISEKTEWMQFDFEYKADGTEKFMLIGNFNDTNAIDTLFVGGGTLNPIDYKRTYYYLDDFYLGHCDSLPEDTAIGLLENTLERNFSVYPNPTRNELNLHYKGKENWQYNLYNLMGQATSIPREVGNSIQLSLAHLPKGIYLLEIIAGKERLSKKIVLE